MDKEGTGMMKKWLAMLLTATMTMTLLAGCGSSGGQTNPAADSAQNA